MAVSGVAAVKEQVTTLAKYVVDVWREIHPRTGKVTWPTAKMIRVSTVVVIISSLLLGGYIFLCDQLLGWAFRFYTRQ